MSPIHDSQLAPSDHSSEKKPVKPMNIDSIERYPTGDDLSLN